MQRLTTRPRLPPLPSSRPHRLTFWLLPARRMPRRIELPSFLIPTLAVLAAVCVAGSLLYASRAQATARALTAESSRLRADAARGRTAAAELARLQQTMRSETANLRGALDQVTQLDGQVRAAAGVHSATATVGLPADTPLVRHLGSAAGVLQRLGTSLPGLSQDLQAMTTAMAGWRVAAADTPSIWPVRGPVTSPYGYRMAPIGGGGLQFHTGVDIGVPVGTPVHATAAGVVEFAGWNNIYGNQVLVNDGGGLTTMYGHNSRLLVHAGEDVQKDQVLALSGSTGWSTGPHVHYEIDIYGHSVNPAAYLPGYGNVASGGGGSSVQASRGSSSFGYGGR